MLVIPELKKLIALKVDNSPEFFIEIGRWLDDEMYKIKEDKTFHSKHLFIIDKRGNEIEIFSGNYILIDSETGEFVDYITENDFENNYIKLKEEN